MQKQILAELKALRSLMAQLVGTADLPEREQFSSEALTTASKLFIKMAAQRGEWVTEHEVGKQLKSDWWAAKFIRTEFGFRAWVKDGRSTLYNKKALQQLGQELKLKNIDLTRYMEYKRSEADFQKKLAANKKSTKGKRPYELPAGLRDITTSAPPAPDPEIVKQDLERLKAEFFENKMADYIDIYKGTHAMFKHLYYFQKYIDPKIKKRCVQWCDNFNYANHALELITRKRETFHPVMDEEMIEL